MCQEKDNKTEGGFFMDEQAREERRKYQREWRRKNKDKVRVINQRYWVNRAQKRLAAQAEAKGSDTE